MLKHSQLKTEPTFSDSQARIEAHIRVVVFGIYCPTDRTVNCRYVRKFESNRDFS
jgi:hypothetical protein